MQKYKIDWIIGKISMKNSLKAWTLSYWLNQIAFGESRIIISPSIVDLYNYN